MTSDLPSSVRSVTTALALACDTCLFFAETVARLGSVASRLSEVARLSGLSEVTVSRLLNGRTRPTAATLAAVLTALDVLGYERPARLRAAPAGIVGLVLPDLRNPTFPAFAEALTVALLRHGYTSALCTRTADGVSEAQYIDMLLAHDTA